MMKKFLVFFLVFCFAIETNAQDSNNETLDTIISRVADTVTGRPGNWRFVINERLMICLTDENNNRMRIISPITEVENVPEQELINALTANFHTALDVKYAISDDVLWSVFIHPLQELSESQMEDAILQVFNAAETYGTLYSSTHLSFPFLTKNKKEKPQISKTIELQKG
ncbi:MAG: hypothetical protein ACI849_001243 [Patiriisocius sp.]|jgi:hypothetical protein